MHSLTPWFIVAKTPIREDNKIIPILTWCLAACITVVLAPTCVGQQLHVLVDQVGYEARAPKQALIMGTTQDDPQQFSLLDAASGKAVLSGTLTSVDPGARVGRRLLDCRLLLLAEARSLPAADKNRSRRNQLLSV